MTAHNKDRASGSLSRRVWRTFKLFVVVAGALCVFALGLFASQSHWFSRTFHNSFQSKQDAEDRTVRQAQNKLWADGSNRAATSCTFVMLNGKSGVTQLPLTPMSLPRALMHQPPDFPVQPA